ncbi:MAG: hypothetical protein H8D32_04910 [Dehalococcoidia bacterium]|nr:hypothetical protein [Dehalococcoidia bacterium]
MAYVNREDTMLTASELARLLNVHINKSHNDGQGMTSLESVNEKELLPAGIVFPI